MITNEEVIKRYNESLELIRENGTEKAREILESLISQIEGISNETETERLYTFDNAVEFVSLIIFLKKEKNSKWIKNVYSKIYMEYARILINSEALEMAKKIIEKAIMWNPMSARNYYVKANIYIKQDDLERYHEENENGGKISLSLKDLSEYFNNLANYYEKKEEYNLACAMYVASLFYCENKKANKKIEKICLKLGDNYVRPQIEEAFIMIKNSNIEILPNIELLTVLYNFANNEYKNEKTNLYLLKQIYELLDKFLDKDDVKVKIEQIDNKIGNKGEEKKVLIISNNHINGKKEGTENKITDRLQIKNQIILSSVSEVIKILIDISKEIHTTIYVRDIKEVLNQLMMNNEKTFLKEYPGIEENTINSVHQYYNMDEKAQKEIMTEIMFGFRKLRDDEIIE